MTRKISYLIVCATLTLAMTSSSVLAAIAANGDITPSSPSTWTGSTGAEIAHIVDGTGLLIVSQLSSVNSQTLDVGSYGDGELRVVAGGTLYTEGNSSQHYAGSIGRYSNSTGLVTVDGDGSTWTINREFFCVGNEGEGTLNISNKGKLIHNNAPGIYIGRYGAGVLNLSSGGSVSATASYLGRYAGSTGSVVVDGQGTTYTSNGCIIGYEGNGALAITNGGVANTTAPVSLGHASTSTGDAVVDGLGSTWNLGNSFIVGIDGKATLKVINEGQINSKYGATLAKSTGSESLLIVDGMGSTFASELGGIIVGDSGNGTMIISNAGAVNNEQGGFIGSGNTGIGVVTVDGIGSMWTNRSNFYIGNSGTGTLNISNGGLVTVAADAWINSNSLLSIEVSNNSMFTVGSALTNNGVIRLATQAGLTTGAYSPITAGGWSGSGAFEAFGGVWDNTTHTFTVSAAATATAGVETTIDLSTQQRINVGDSLCLNFAATGSSTSLGLTATVTNGQAQSNLQSLLSDGESVEGSWDFSVTGLPGGASVLLQFAVSGTADADDLIIWHNDGTGWTEYGADDLMLSGGWASFTVDSFSSYAVTIPEPATMSLLALGGMAMLRRRKK